MWKWLNPWKSAKGRVNPKVKEASLPPLTLPYPAPRTAVTQALPSPLAVDVSESNLFYRSIEGKLVCCSILSGDIRWESIDGGYPLRVSDEILWVEQGGTIAAYTTTNGQLLMRSQPLWLPGGVTHTLCDLSEQTLRLYSTYFPPPPNEGIYQYRPPSNIDKAAYEVSLITGEVTTLYQVTLYPQDWDKHCVVEPGYSIRPRTEASLTRLPVLPRDELRQFLENHRRVLEEGRRKARQAYHWPNWQEVKEQEYSSPSCEQMMMIAVSGGSFRAAQVQTASVVIHEYFTGQFSTYQTVLSVFHNQTLGVRQWEAFLEEFYREPPHC
jgi:hypothetical protein